MEIGKIAFLETYTLEDNGGIMGAILVADAETKPLEFRVTAPVKPTTFQKTLYGDVLLEHVLVELISVPLLNAINEQIDLILVKDPLFLGANSKQAIRVLRITTDEKSKSRAGSKAEEIKQSSGEKLYIETSKKFESELQGIKESLERIAEHRNLIEPFDRLKIACEQVQSQKTND
ncbi:MAG: hypothetical protein MUO34_07225 [Ignavibacteriaceae bacterium]|nr:hypothetical protein [Ignavibacteriaceae bacterium]